MIIKEGQYIVTLKIRPEFSTCCAKENYCFEQRRDSYYMEPDIDISGVRANGNSGLTFDCSSQLLEWRYATPQEIAEYQRLGRPYDVTECKWTSQTYEIY